ncbi:ABC transporter substrate-binding protein [Xiamenia xianingshaonis]|uniref:ABC transporter substrate-binding protein n=2 Tax=Xiamenia xianingshaonis TaxID=2682776 RepID=A0A9E6SV88_9ACTN|nr:ABC transporter substrate-binding protein [Xiamenia xianingshaonis]QTU85027.1 ABC transporter substrate-binding protein [Xiamenia xianingshaonis]
MENNKTEATCPDQNRMMTRRRFVGLSGASLAVLMFGGTLAGCAGGEEAPAESGSKQEAPAESAPAAEPAAADIDFADWDAVLEAAKGQTVSWYGWGGDEARNNWINTVLAPALKEKYDVTLELVGMDINDILTQLSGEMQAGVEEGSIDFIWINGENFYSCKENDYLWGPFTDYLPNFNDYIDPESPEVLYDFGSPTEGYECPYGKAQMQMWYDSKAISDPPTTVEAFKTFCEQHKGQVTYPEPGDFVGTAFISCLIAGVIGKEEFEKLSSMSEPTEEAVLEVVQPGLDYLRELNPYLWKEGATFPADSSTVATMYADGELVLNMGYGAPQELVETGQLPESTRSFIFDSGTVGNSNFMAIAANAPHKAAALVAINEVVSPEMQLSIYENLSGISVLDMERLPEEDQQAFADVPLGETQIPLDELLAHRVSEASGPVIPILEKLWLEQVAQA